MVRHYKEVHKKSASESREMVMNLHGLLMANLEKTKQYAKVTGNTKYFGRIEHSEKGKLEAEFGLSHETARLNMDEDAWMLVKHFRGDQDVEVIEGVVCMKAGKRRPLPDPSKRARVVPESRKRDPDGRIIPGSGMEHQSPLGGVHRSGSDRQQSSESFTKAWADSEHPDAVRQRQEQRNKDFPDALGPPGQESQSLTQTGKKRTESSTKSPPTSGAAPVSVRQPASAPEDAIWTQFDGKPFFRKEDAMSAGIQQVVFDRWQSHFHTIVTDSAVAIKSLTLAAVQEIQENEIARIKQEQTGLVSDVLKSAQNARDEHEAATGYLEERMAKLSKQFDRMNIRFRSVFGVNFDDWEGTLESAETLLENAKKARALRAEALLNQGTGSGKPKPPPPPPPPPAAGQMTTV